MTKETATPEAETEQPIVMHQLTAEELRDFEKELRKELKSHQKKARHDHKKIRQDVVNLKQTRFSEDMGTQKHLLQVIDYFDDLMQQPSEHMDVGIDLCRRLALNEAHARMKNPIHSVEEELEVATALINTYHKHLKMLGVIVYFNETLEAMGVAEGELKKRLNEKKNIISKAVGKGKDAAVGGINLTTRVMSLDHRLDGGLTKIGKDREIKQ